uniref:type IIL restriction-modification enzyme MmeI n=1 Tax=Parasutterella excrementihominis TaxID=487175 RepID=UPI003FEFC482
KRVEAVKEYRLKILSAGTRKIAKTPTRFHVTNLPIGTYIVIPQVSSERRQYIPIGYMDDGVLCSDKVWILPDGSLYHFGVLTSNVHMAWMRTICCRPKSDYSYTVNDVYNNFPWPTPTDAQKAKIEQTAQTILNARGLYPDASLADLYDETTMPPELRKAHQQNDKAVMQAYGFSVRDMTESKCVAELMRMYQELIR